VELIGRTSAVAVTSVLQTPAGRMVFTEVVRNRISSSRQDQAG
jgi:uncharacterized protein YacL